jgi:predicted permease
MEQFSKHLTQTVRRLARTPLFAFVTLVTLAVSIGANTAIFAVVNGVLLKPLPYPEPERLVGVWQTAPGINVLDLNMSPADYFTHKEETRTFEQFGLWDTGTASVTGRGDPQQVHALYVTDGTLQALAIQPLLGRSFSAADDSPKSPRTAILSYGYWQRTFGGDNSVIGQQLIVNSSPHEIIGVMPSGFRFLDENSDVILPSQFDRAKVTLGNYSYQGIARLKPGVTIDQANADLARIIPIVQARFSPPAGFTVKMFAEARFGPNIRPLKADVIGDASKVLWVLMGTIGIVLLIACANVANLLLVRAEGRQHELAIRAALGAGWRQIAGELWFESVFLAAVGGALGAALAYRGLRLLLAIGPSTLPRLSNISIDRNVLLFTLAVSIGTGLLFGLAPVLRYAGPHLIASLRGVSRTVSHSRERHRARNTLVVVQIALALVLLISSGLMIRTFLALRQVEPGFTRPEELQTVRLRIPEADVKEPDRVFRMQHEILQKIAAIPGIAAASFGSGVPMDGNQSADPIFAEDRSYREGEVPPIRSFKSVAPGFYRTIGTPLIAGRDIEWDDLYQKRSVVLISENLARELWKEPTAALGKRVRDGSKMPWHEIIGVVGNVYDKGANQKPPETVYWPMITIGFDGMESVSRGVTYVIRSNRVHTESFVNEIRRAVWAVNPNLPVASVRTLDDIYHASMARTSFTLVMLAIAGAMALLLGVVGIYGVMSYAVSQRTREIGIRIALGAQKRSVHRLFVRHGLMLAALGAGFGVAASAALSRLMTSLLFNVHPMDPLTYAVVTAGLVVAALAASYLPARKATAVDPLESLRAE